MDNDSAPYYSLCMCQPVTFLLCRYLSRSTSSTSGERRKHGMGSFPAGKTRYHALQHELDEQTDQNERVQRDEGYVQYICDYIYIVSSKQQYVNI